MQGKPRTASRGGAAVAALIAAQALKNKERRRRRLKRCRGPPGQGRPARAPRLALGRKRRFERRHPGLERFVFLAREPRHVLDRLELLARTTSRSRRMRSAWLRNSVSNSRRTPCAMPAASFINRAASSKNRFVVCTMSPPTWSACRASSAACHAQTMAMVRRGRKGRRRVRKEVTTDARPAGPALPRHQSDTDSHRAAGGALVRAGLYRRHHRRLVLCARDHRRRRGYGAARRRSPSSISTISSFGSRSASSSAAASAMCCSTISRISPRIRCRSSQLWNGGMSFHGGFLGCIVAIVAFALRRGIPCFRSAT